MLYFVKFYHRSPALHLSSSATILTLRSSGDTLNRHRSDVEPGSPPALPFICPAVRFGRHLQSQSSATGIEPALLLKPDVNTTASAQRTVVTVLYSLLRDRNSLSDDATSEMPCCLK